MLRVKQEYNTGAEMINASCRKKCSKLALVSLSPLFLVVFVVGWIISWIAQLGNEHNTNTHFAKIVATQSSRIKITNVKPS
jgi:hypothetical protein